MYDKDGRIGRTQNSADVEVEKDQVRVYKFLVKLAVFPAWIVVIFLKRRQRKREMIRFANSFLKTDGFTARDVAKQWAEKYYRNYPFAEYSSNFPRLVSEFQRIISNSPQLTRRSMSS